MQLTQEQFESIRRWAQDTPQIRCAYLFGSRAKGTARPDSDVDLAIGFHCPDHEVQQMFFSHGEHWQNKLRAATGLKVCLAHLAGSLTPKHTAYVAECNIVIFEQD